jgi:hypothetical protein
MVLVSPSPVPPAFSRPAFAHVAAPQNFPALGGENFLTFALFVTFLLLSLNS